MPAKKAMNEKIVTGFVSVIKNAEMAACMA